MYIFLYFFHWTFYKVFIRTSYETLSAVGNSPIMLTLEKWRENDWKIFILCFVWGAYLVLLADIIMILSQLCSLNIILPDKPNKYSIFLNVYSWGCVKHFHMIDFLLLEFGQQPLRKLSEIQFITSPFSNAIPWGRKIWVQFTFMFVAWILWWIIKFCLQACPELWKMNQMH